MKRIVPFVSLLLACLFSVALCVSCSKKIDYTVTKEEFLENWNVTNVTMKMEVSDVDERWGIYFTENAQAQIKNDEAPIYTYLKIDDQWHGLSESDGVWSARPCNYFNPTLLASLFDYQTSKEREAEERGVIESWYDHATYSSEEHCYIIDANEVDFGDGTLRFYFENKKMVQMKLESKSQTDWQILYFSNHGKTKIDTPIPEYTIVK